MITVYNCFFNYVSALEQQFYDFVRDKYGLKHVLFAERANIFTRLFILAASQMAASTMTASWMVASQMTASRISVSNL